MCVDLSLQMEWRLDIRIECMLLRVCVTRYCVVAETDKAAAAAAAAVAHAGAAGRDSCRVASHQQQDFVMSALKGGHSGRQLSVITVGKKGPFGADRSNTVTGSLMRRHTCGGSRAQRASPQRGVGPGGPRSTDCRIACFIILRCGQNFSDFKSSPPLGGAAPARVVSPPLHTDAVRFIFVFASLMSAD